LPVLQIFAFGQQDHLIQKKHYRFLCQQRILQISQQDPLYYDAFLQAVKVLKDSQLQTLVVLFRVQQFG
jgi:hypothetical protein